MSICVRRFDPEVPMRRTEAQWLVGDDDGACDDAFHDDVHVRMDDWQLHFLKQVKG